MIQASAKLTLTLLLIVVVYDRGLAGWASRCSSSSTQKSSAVSVTLAMEYNKSKSVLKPLVGVKADTKIYTEIAKGFTDNIQVINDSHTEFVASKQRLLQHLTKITKSHPVVNLNIAGHGLLNSQNEFMLLLPSFPAACARVAPNEYRRFEKRDQVSWDQFDCDRYVVTAKELAKVLKGKKVFGLIDTCYSGAIDLGSEASFIYSAQGHQKANDSESGGLITQKIKEVIRNKNLLCQMDQDRSKSISFAELIQDLPSVYLPIETSNDLLPTLFRDATTTKAPFFEEVQKSGSNKTLPFTRCYSVLSNNQDCPQEMQQDPLKGRGYGPPKHRKRLSDQ